MPALPRAAGSMRIYGAAWIALLAFYAVALAANGVTPALAIRNAFANLIPDALFGLALLRLPSYVQWPKGGRVRFFTTHVALLGAFVILAAAGWIGLVTVDALLFTGRAEAHINVRIVPFRVLYDVLIYCTITGIAYAMSNAAELREQAERAARAESLRAQASLQAMRSQLNPHFILNTFHAVVGLVRRDPATAERALERLGDLLRRSLQMQRDGIDEVRLADECTLVSNYLELEQLRLGDRLRVNLDVPPAALQCLVPTFALQILAENAVRHAIAPRAAGGLLHIAAEVRNGSLRLMVTDQTTGEAADPADDGSRLGLRLLQERLSALYGGSTELRLEAVPGGTRAIVELPARQAAEEDA